MESCNVASGGQVALWRQYLECEEEEKERRREGHLVKKRGGRGRREGQVIAGWGG